MVRDESLSRSLMLLCFGIAVLFLGVQQISFFNPIVDVVTINARQAKRQPLKKLPLGDIRLLVDLSERQVYVYHKNRLQVRYPVAIGQSGWETPTGSFQVINMQRHPVWRHPITGNVSSAGPDNPLGDRWIGFWSNGQQQIGFHGTPEESLVGKAISHGCLRMRNQDIRTLYGKVKEGTLVAVRP